jgi:hypothetical protein
MEQIFDTVVEFRGRFEVEQFHIGRTNSDPSRLRMRIDADDPHSLQQMLAQLLTLGCSIADSSDAELRTVEQEELTLKGKRRKGERAMIAPAPSGQPPYCKRRRHPPGASRRRLQATHRQVAAGRLGAPVRFRHYRLPRLPGDYFGTLWHLSDLPPNGHGRPAYGVQLPLAMRRR